MVMTLAFQLLGSLVVATFKVTTTSEVNLNSWGLIDGL